MRRLKKIINFFSLIAFGLLASAVHAVEFEIVEPEEAGFDRSKLEGLKAVADQLYDDGRIPNYVIALYKGNNNFYQVARGRTGIETGQAVDANTIFHMASMTKPLVSTAVFRLIQEGKLSLNDPLSKFFPQFSQMMVAPGGDFGNQFEPAEREIEIIDLLTHTSGFSYSQAIAGFGDVGQLYDELSIFSTVNPELTMTDHLSNLSEVPLVAQPGTQFNYSVSTDVLGAIIEKITGLDLASYLDQILFRPLGMTQSQFVLTESQVPQMSNVFGSLGFNPSARFDVFGKLSTDENAIDWKIGDVFQAERFLNKPRWYSGGGGLLSSANDYATYLTMVANQGSVGGIEILTPEFAALHSKSLVPSLTIDGFRRVFGDSADYMTFGGGFGIKREVDDLDAIDYIFWAGAFNTFFWLDPKDGSIGLFLTAHWPVQYNISDRLEQLVDEARL